MDRHIWEGWTVQMFIDDLTPMFNQIMSGQSWHKPFEDSKVLKQWCKDNQPGYKKHIPEVFNYFNKKLNENIKLNITGDLRHKV